jgi:hypothetical protein
MLNDKGHAFIRQAWQGQNPHSLQALRPAFVSHHKEEMRGVRVRGQLDA